MLPVILCIALEIGIIPGNVGIVDQSLVMPEYALYQAVELEVVIDHVFLGGEARLYEWNDKDEYSFWPIGIEAAVFAGIRFSPFEVGWRYRVSDQLLPSTPSYGIFQNQGYHEIYLRMESTNELR